MLSINNTTDAKLEPNSTNTIILSDLLHMSIKRQAQWMHCNSKAMNYREIRMKEGEQLSGAREKYRNVIPKLKPYVAMRALFTRIIPTDVTILNIHDATSIAVFLSPLVAEDILTVSQSLKTNDFVCIRRHIIRSGTGSNETS